MFCKVDIPAVEGLKEKELTVGREFYLNCTVNTGSTWPKDLAQEKLQFVLSPEQKYQIKLLGFEFRTSETADIKVTGYQAGTIDFKNLQLTDQTQTVDLGPVQYEMITVLEQPKEGQPKVEAFGPMGPASIAFPLVYIFAFVLLFSVLGIFITRKVFRWNQRRRLRLRLRQHDSPMAPLPQFHQSLRRLRRENSVFYSGEFEKAQIQSAFGDLDKMLRLFLIRELQVPAMEWSDKLILKDLRKYHRAIHDEAGTDLKKLLGEFNLAEKNKSMLSAQDILVLSEQTRRCVEKIDKLKNQVEPETRRGGL